jgi:hypothetical protein
MSGVDDRVESKLEQRLLQDVGGRRCVSDTAEHDVDLAGPQLLEQHRVDAFHHRDR